MAGYHQVLLEMLELLGELTVHALATRKSRKCYVFFELLTPPADLSSVWNSCKLHLPEINFCPGEGCFTIFFRMVWIPVESVASDVPAVRMVNWSRAGRRLMSARRRQRAALGQASQLWRVRSAKRQSTIPKESKRHQKALIIYIHRHIYIYYIYTCMSIKPVYVLWIRPNTI